MKGSKKKQNTKKIIFWETEDRQARLRIRLNHDKMGQSDFFRMMIEFYLENDERVITLMDDYKKRMGQREKTFREQNKKAIEAGREVKRQFGLDEDQIEDIFDLIGKEFPDF